MPEAVIIEALRTPIARGKMGKGELSGLHPASDSHPMGDLLPTVLDILVEHPYFYMFAILFLCGLGLPIPEEVTLIAAGLLVAICGVLMATVGL